MVDFCKKTCLRSISRRGAVLYFIPKQLRNNVIHNKFIDFHYYNAIAKYKNDTFNLWINVGASKYDNANHRYSITNKHEDALNTSVDSRPMGYAIENASSNNSIPDSAQESNSFAENSLEISDEVLNVLSLQQAEALVSRGIKGDALLFSTKKDGIVLDYGEAVVEAKIPLEKLELNDVFDDEVHLTMKVKPYTMNNICYSLADDVENTWRLWYNEIKLPNGELNPLQSEALTYDANHRNEIRSRTLSNGITYRYVIDDDGMVHPLSMKKSRKYSRLEEQIW